MCIKKLKGLFRSKLTEKPPKPEEKPVITWLDRLRAKFPSFRYISTSRGGHNMPVFQTCPDCRSNSKRQHKTVGGAMYRCRSHGEFLVKRVGV